MDYVKDKVLDCFENLAAAKGTNAKKALLKEYLNNLYFSTLMSYTFNPYRSFHVVKVPKVKKENRKPIEPQEAWKLFILNADACSKREVTGNAAINLIHSTFQQCSEAQEKWMRKILKKNLAIGISTKTINKVMPGLIPTFDVALAQKFERKRMSSTVYVEPKLDGIRCLAIVKDGDVKLFTRAGKPLTNFDDTIGKELLQLKDGCYDGEIMGKDFTDLMRQVYRKENVNVDNSYFAIFDYISIPEWDAKVGESILTLRKAILDSIFHSTSFKFLQLVPYTYSEDPPESLLKDIHDDMVAKGYEGIMIKDSSAFYSFGRDWSVMKYKAFFDADCPIVGLKEGTGKHQGKLGSFLVDYKGVEVNVGSGLNDELREIIWKDRDSHIGRIIEVRYQEETPDGSLRFPTFVCFRNDKE